MSVEHKGFPIEDEEEIPLFQRKLRSSGGVILFLFIVLLVPFFPTFLFGVAAYLFLKQSWMRRFYDFCHGQWLLMCAILTELLFGIRHRVFGYKGKFDPRCIMIMNHRCHLDWFFLWSVMARKGDLTSWKAMMKTPIKRIPFFGWAMQCFMHIFLHRNWEQDKEEISNKLHYMNLLKCPIQLLTFPDGGDLNFRSKSKSDQFAEKNNLQKYDYVLQPKTKGFTHSAAILKKAGLDSIFDITIAYPDALPKTEVDFYNGVIPREVNYYIERFNINDLPKTEIGLAEWCQERWRIKEERLRYFYQHRTFQEESFLHSNGNGMTNGSHRKDMSNGWTGNSVLLNSGELCTLGNIPFFTFHGLLSAVLLFASLNSILIFLSYHYFFAMIAIFIPCIAHWMYHGQIGSGLDQLELQLVAEQIKQAKTS